MSLVDWCPRVSVTIPPSLFLGTIVSFQKIGARKYLAAKEIQGLRVKRGISFLADIKPDAL
jgi:hypothetical protein